VFNKRDTKGYDRKFPKKSFKPIGRYRRWKIFHSKSISIPKDIHYLLDKITILILIYPRDTIKEEKRI
jgi:hypothetical protein